MFWMGIDVGTGGTRALLTDRNGAQIAAFTAPHRPIEMERPLWAEQDPENWAQAGIEAIRGVLRETGIPGKKIAGIGLSGQMHGLVMLDEYDNVIRPALIWCDQRSQAQVDSINQIAGKENILAWTANPMLTGFTLPKLLWVRDHEPANFARVRKILLPKDYLRWKLSGEHATDVSDASGTGLFDVVRRRWSWEMIDAAGLGREILPRVYESTDIAGTVSAEAAALTGLEPGTPVIAGGGDQAASAVGNGIVRPGIASCTLGTSGVIFAHMAEPRYDPLGRVHTFCHAVRGEWHLMGVTQGAGLSLQWFRNRLAEGAAYDDLMLEAARAPAGSDGLFWLPYLMGERTPHLDAHARGGWVGLTARHTRADLIRSIVEGVCFSQKDGLDIIESLGIEIACIRASGGGARSPLWRQVLADILAKDVVCLESQEGSAYGAALLAMVGTGEYASVPEACAAVIRETGRVRPRAPEAALYRKAHEVYRALYPALVPIYAKIAESAS